MRSSRSTGGKKTPLRDRISPRAVRGYPGGGPRAVPGVPRASQRRKFVAEQLKLIQPSLYEHQTLSKNWTVAPERLPEGRPALATAPRATSHALGGMLPPGVPAATLAAGIFICLLPIHGANRYSPPHPACGSPLWDDTGESRCPTRNRAAESGGWEASNKPATSLQPWRGYSMAPGALGRHCRVPPTAPPARPAVPAR